MVQKNWAAIERLKDQRLKNAVALTTDPELLTCYAKGFPHLFVRDGRSPDPYRIPLSVLVEASRENARRRWQPGNNCELDAHLNLSGAEESCSDLKLPELFMWEEGEDAPSADVQKLFNQLIGQKIKAGMTVVHEKRRCLVMDLYLPFFLGAEDQVLGTPIEERYVDFEETGTAFLLITLTDLNLVNLDA